MLSTAQQHMKPSGPETFDPQPQTSARRKIVGSVLEGGEVETPVTKKMHENDMPPCVADALATDSGVDPPTMAGSMPDVAVVDLEAQRSSKDVRPRLDPCAAPSPSSACTRVSKPTMLRHGAASHDWSRMRFGGRC